MRSEPNHQVADKTVTALTLVKENDTPHPLTLPNTMLEETVEKLLIPERLSRRVKKPWSVMGAECRLFWGTFQIGLQQYISQLVSGARHEQEGIKVISQFRSQVEFP